MVRHPRLFGPRGLPARGGYGTPWRPIAARLRVRGLGRAPEHLLERRRASDKGNKQPAFDPPTRSGVCDLPLFGVQDGVSLAECKEGCCNSEECIAYGHCMDGAASCIWPIGAQHCTWYKTRGSRLSRSDGHFTGIFHDTKHCTPVPGSGGQGEGGKDKLPEFDKGPGWEVVMLLGTIALLYLGAGLSRRYSAGDGSWVLNRQFWSSLGGLVIDGASFAAHPFRMHQTTPLAVTARSRSATSEGSLKSPLLPSSLTGDRQASRGRPTALHNAASVGQAARLRVQIQSARPGELDAGDTKQYTPFHVACAGGHAEAVCALLEAGCDPTLRCDTGDTGWELAAKLKRESVLALQRNSSWASAAAPTSREGKHKKAKQSSRKSKKVTPTSRGGTQVQAAPAKSSGSASGNVGKRVVL